MTSPFFARRANDLSAWAWQFGWAPPQPWPSYAQAQAPFDLGAVQEWLPASVLGDVQANAATPLSRLALRLPARFSSLRLELRQGNSLLAHNVYNLRFHDAGPASVGQAVRRRMVDLILR